MHSFAGSSFRSRARLGVVILHRLPRAKTLRGSWRPFARTALLLWVASGQSVANIAGYVRSAFSIMTGAKQFTVASPRQRDLRAGVRRGARGHARIRRLAVRENGSG